MITDSLQAGGYYARLMLAASATFSGNDATFHAFSERIGAKGVYGFGSSYVLTEVETNYKGALEADFLLEGVGVEIVFDTINAATNAAAAYEFLTKTSVIVEIDDRKIVLGPAYQWPSGFQPGNLQYIPSSSTTLADATLLARGGQQRMLAEPITLPANTKPIVRFATNNGDPPVLPAAQIFVDVRLMGTGRVPVRG